MTLVIPGRPAPYVRMTTREVHMAGSRRWSGTTKSRRIARYLEWCRVAGWHAKAARVPCLRGPVKLSVRVYLVQGRRGDLSNYLKAVEDALNGIAWRDDRQVERYGESGFERAVSRQEERVEIDIEEVPA